MADKIPFKSSGNNPKEDRSSSSVEQYKGIEAFRRVTNSLAAQQQRRVAAPSTSAADGGGRVGNNLPQQTVSRRKKGREGVGSSPFQQSNPFSIANTSAVMVPEEPVQEPVGNLAVRRSESEMPNLGPAIKRKGGLAEQNELLASFHSSASAESAAATNPFLHTVGGTEVSDSPFSKSKKPLSKAPVTAKPARDKATTSKPSLSAKSRVEDDKYWMIPVESLASGVANALGDAVGGIVNAGQYIGGKRKKRKQAKKSTPRSEPTVKYRQSAGSIMSGTVSGGVKNIFSGAGQIVKGGTGIVKGGAGIVVGSLGCLGGAIVCMSGTVKEPLVANKQ
ncbi:MAG: hypothetical protein HQL69_08065 [Magnetococcales bacterium]|nr:hypothetical protein [Magnetococcales bacterium]